MKYAPTLKITKFECAYLKTTSQRPIRIRGFPIDSVDELIDRAQDDVEEGRVLLLAKPRIGIVGS